MKEILIKKYEAADGTQFDKQADCLNYELIESAKTIKQHCVSMTECFNCVFHVEDSTACRLTIPEAWRLEGLESADVWSAKDLEESEDENKR